MCERIEKPVAKARHFPGGIHLKKVTERIRDIEWMQSKPYGGRTGKG